MRWAHVRLCVVIVFVANTAFAAAPEKETFGAEANPTGNPIGGGKGYTKLVTRFDVKVKTADELIAALGKATAGQVVTIDDKAEIDLTKRVKDEQFVLEIPGGVTLASGRGKDGSAGGLLLSTEFKTQPLIRIKGPNVRITGLRVRGPDPERRSAELSKRLKEGGRKLYYAFPTSDGILCDQEKLEVDNCEISGWSHAGVFLRKGATASVHHNHIHHCQRYALGYGVCLDQATAKIEANRFDWCRHHIAGTGRPDTNYEACYNVVGPNANSHSFDMHGGADRKDGTDVAGTWIKIHHNTFEATSVWAVVIRGRPAKTCEVHHNWFHHASAAKTVRQSNARGNLHVWRNHVGPKRTLVPGKPPPGK